jgi:tetratricopeptide (TPR) repeat protein
MLSHLRLVATRTLGPRKILPKTSISLLENRSKVTKSKRRHSSTSTNSHGLSNIEAKRYTFSKQIIESLQPIKCNLSPEPRQAKKEQELLSPLINTTHVRGNDWFEQCRAHTLNNNPVKALECINQALLTDPHNALFLQEKAQLLFVRRQFSDAIELYDRILREGSHPALDTIWYNKALAVYSEKEDLNQALLCLSKAIETNPREKTYWLLKSKILNNMNRPDESYQAAEELFKLDHNDPLTWQWKAELLADMGNIEEANRWFHKVEQAHAVSSAK